jgi:hypothetical protein
MDRTRTTSTGDVSDAVAYLRSPAAIRARCENLLARALDGGLAHFAVDLGRVPAVAERVVAVTRAAYPDLAIPYHSRWNHFRAGGVDRVAALEAELAGLDAAGRARTLVHLVVPSVLHDAGAGDRWRYREPDTGLVLARSEGLAVASYHMFRAGAFSGRRDRPLAADAGGLERITDADVARAFQVGPDNPLVGVAGRAGLLRALGAALRGAPALFTPSTPGGAPRVGDVVDVLRAGARGGPVPAAAVLDAVLVGLGPIWPGRVALGGVNLGDVWPHPAAGGDGPSAGLVPFHKLSQWLTYSLLEPLEAAGLAITGVDELTGLPEYRNGGLLIDLGVLAPRHAGVTARAHRPGDEIVVEWRALTVALLDRVADGVRAVLGLDRAALPLAKVLEGGTWSTGRAVARELRPGGVPPLEIDSDGTVF